MSRAASLGLAHASVISALVAGISLSSARSPRAASLRHSHAPFRHSCAGRNPGDR